MGIRYSYQTMQVMKSFNICWKATTVFLIDLDLIRLEPRLGSFTYWDRETSIYSHISDLSVLATSTQTNSHPTPNASHAASTSGPASCRYAFVFSSEPLKVTVCNEVSTSFNTGATKWLATQFYLYLFRKKYVQYRWTCRGQISFAFANQKRPSQTPNPIKKKDATGTPNIINRKVPLFELLRCILDSASNDS